MKRLANLALLSTGLVFGLFACRGGGSGDDNPPMPDAPIGGSVKVKDVQADTMPKGTAVELKGVIVTAIDTFGARTGDFWVEDPEGGAFSGVKVFGAPLDQLAALQVGDIVDVTNGEKDEFALTSDMSGRTVTEVKGAGGGMLTVTKKGTGSVPPPMTVDAKMIATLDKASREMEWEKWEGVLIKVTNARELAAAKTFGSNPDVDSHEFRITGIARVQSVLADLNADADFGVCYDSITGVGDYFFNDLILPRATSDIVSGGTGCNPLATTVVQSQTTPGAELAKLTNVVVVGRDDIGTTTKGYWVADSATAAVNAGVYVFTGSTAAPANFTIGAVVDVQGFMSEFDVNGAGMTPPSGDTLTELTVDGTATGTFKSAGGALTPMTVTADQVNVIGAAGEPYEAVLVKIDTLKVTNTALGQGKIELTDNAAHKIVMDDDAFAYTAPAMGACLNVTGIMSVQLNDDIRTINPRQAADIATGTGCN